MSRLPYILPWILPWALTLAGCARGAESPESPDIRDVASLKQDCRAYLDPATADKPLIGPEALARLNKEFHRQWMRPWDPQCAPPVAGEVQKPFAHFEAKPGYGENFQPHTAAFAKRLRTLAGLGNYPNRTARAITVRNTNLRSLPTHWPRFEKINQAGEGFPFDSFQESALWAGTPLLACHASADGQWLYVDSPCGRGWVPAQDVAAVDDQAIRRYQQSRLVALTKDNVALVDVEPGVFLFSTHIGAVFPLAAERPDGLEVLAPARDAQGKVVLRRAVLSKAQAAVMPLAPTPANIAAIANQMLGQPYGWGGMFEGRDCSATTRDLMTPFGIWLPRNSSDQARAYRTLPLKGLPGPQKQALLIEKGVPFLTLVNLPGHVALYIGHDQQRAFVMHNFWGIRTRTNGVEGRKIVGRCAITTIQPGLELPDLDLPAGDWRGKIESMVLVGIEKEQPPSAP